MTKMTIKNMKDNENYIKDFNTVEDAKDWVINHCKEFTKQNKQPRKDK